jgi:hypothetical protein
LLNSRTTIGGEVKLSAQASEEGGPALFELTPPACVASGVALTGSPVPPQQHLFFYSSTEWELFIREWATALETDYAQVKQLGGSNDRGVDVAAFKTPQGFEGAWDCFQGKHYSTSLNLSDVLPEILKLFLNFNAGHYILPDTYAFLAPQGCGSSLNRLLSRPTELRDKFLEKLETGSLLIAGLASETVQEVRALATTVDFSIFKSVELADALEVHRRTPYYTARFGGPLTPRDPAAAPPDDLAEIEARYVAQLVEVYSEKHPEDELVGTALSSHPVIGPHFQRQRFAFYCAEALRLYARDSVPEGTFEALQADVHAGVVEVAESVHATGMDRLSQVLTTSGQLDLSSHTLVSVSDFNDRKGICHQLANEDRLAWMWPDQ